MCESDVNVVALGCVSHDNVVRVGCVRVTLMW